jgi:hypothetical protein
VVKPSAIMIVQIDGPKNATIASARKSNGKQSTTSIRRETSQSATPP